MALLNLKARIEPDILSEYDDVWHSINASSDVDRYFSAFTNIVASWTADKHVSSKLRRHDMSAYYYFCGRGLGERLRFACLPGIFHETDMEWNPFIRAMPDWIPASRPEVGHTERPHQERAIEEDEYERGKEYYSTHRVTLEKTYPNKFIAIWRDEVISYGDSFGKVAQAAYEQVGYRDMYIPKVEKKRTPMRMPSPRFKVVA